MLFQPLTECCVVHADVKVANTLVFKIDNKLIAKVTNFGSMVELRSTDSTGRLFKALGGTVPYQAPELIFDSRYMSPSGAISADVFSYGMLVWNVFTGGTMISADGNSTITAKDRIRKIEELKLNDSLLGHAQWEVTQRFSQRPGFGHPDMVSRILRSTLPKSKLDRATSFAAILEIFVAIVYCHSFIRSDALAHFSRQIAPPKRPI